MQNKPNDAHMHCRNGGDRINTDQMMRSGAIAGPYKRIKPRTLPLWVRVLRAWDARLLQVGEFISIYRQYRKANGRRYSARIAYGCAFLGLPF